MQLYAEEEHWKVDEALDTFIAKKPWHTARNTAEDLKQTLQHYRDHFTTPLQQAQIMMKRIGQLAELPTPTALSSKYLDREMDDGIAALHDLSDAFLTFKNASQRQDEDSPDMERIRRYFSDTDDVLKAIADDAEKIQTLITRARTAGGQRPSNPPPLSA